LSCQLSRGRRLRKRALSVFDGVFILRSFRIVDHVALLARHLLLGRLVRGMKLNRWSEREVLTAHVEPLQSLLIRR